MEPASPYRIAWQQPPPVNVRASNRAAVLEALEHGFPTSRRCLQVRTGLCPLTLRRACRQLIREGVATLKYGQDPETGIACDLVTPASYPVLPILDISEARMTWRLCTTCGESVFAATQERGPFRSFEDDLELLMGRVTSILRAGTCHLPARVPLQAPVLLCATPNDRILKTVERVLEVPPQMVLTPTEAAAQEIHYLPMAHTAGCVLHLTTGPSATATFLVRRTLNDPESPLVPLPYVTDMSNRLCLALARIPRHSPAYTEGVLHFLQSACRSVTPDCLILEHDFLHDPARSLSALLPQTTALHCIPLAHNTPPLSHRGALRLSRRALWDSMISEPLPAEAMTRAR